MKNPSYRITTFTLDKMSDNLQSFLSQSANDNMRMRDVIAINLLSPFPDSHLPFACTFVGWCSNGYEGQLQDIFDGLNSLTTSSGTENVSVEGFGNRLEGGRMLISGAYPLLDLKAKFIESEYQKVSLILNRQLTNRITAWIEETLVINAIQSDKLGIVSCIIGESDSLLESKMQEILTLIQKVVIAEVKDDYKETTDIDDINLVLAKYVNYGSAMGGYLLYMGTESQVFEKVVDLVNNVYINNREIIETNEFGEPPEFKQFTRLADLEGYEIDGSSYDGEIASIIYYGVGRDGVSALIDYLILDSEIEEHDWLWTDGELDNARLRELKRRLKHGIDARFLDELRDLIPFRT